MQELIKNKLIQIKATIELFYEEGKLLSDEDVTFIDELKADYVLYSLMLKVIQEEKGKELLSHLNMTEDQALDAIADYDLDFLICVCNHLNYDYSFFLPYILQKQISL
jgi:hypothetical protein